MLTYTLILHTVRHTKTLIKKKNKSIPSIVFLLPKSSEDKWRQHSKKRLLNILLLKHAVMSPTSAGRPSMGPTETYPLGWHLLSNSLLLNPSAPVLRLNGPGRLSPSEEAECWFPMVTAVFFLFCRVCLLVFSFFYVVGFGWCGIFCCCARWRVIRRWELSTNSSRMPAR